MEVKTLVAMMMQEFDEVDWYDDDFSLISKMSPGTLLSEYGDFKVKKFGIYEAEDMTTLELVLR